MGKKEMKKRQHGIFYVKYICCWPWIYSHVNADLKTDDHIDQIQLVALVFTPIRRNGFKDLDFSQGYCKIACECVRKCVR